MSVGGPTFSIKGIPLTERNLQIAALLGNEEEVPASLRDAGAVRAPGNGGNWTRGEFFALLRSMEGTKSNDVFIELLDLGSATPDQLFSISEWEKATGRDQRSISGGLGGLSGHSRRYYGHKSGPYSWKWGDPEKGQDRRQHYMVTSEVAGWWAEAKANLAA